MTATSQQPIFCAAARFSQKPVPHGKARLVRAAHVLLLASLAALLVTPAQAVQTDLHGPAGSAAFGTSVTVLPNDNVVVTDPLYSIPGGAQEVGAVYLYGKTGTLISTLTGSNAGDQVGLTPPLQASAVTVLTNGNYVITTSRWHNGQGAVTWGSATTGVSGVVSAANSLTGSLGSDNLGNQGISPLSNGNYVVCSPSWNGNVGAVTWGNGATGTTGTVSSDNSLVGAAANDYTGSGTADTTLSTAGNGVTPLPDGSYVVTSPQWNGTIGAATWCSTTGATGVVSATNSLVGSAAGDKAGSGGVVVLTNGNFVIVSPTWAGELLEELDIIPGAATWCRSAAAAVGEISSDNSFLGSPQQNPDSLYYQVKFVTALTNGNYVVLGLGYDSSSNTYGSVTWANGSTGLTGQLTNSNTFLGEGVAIGTVTLPTGNGFVQETGPIAVALTNGNYVIPSPNWNNNIGAVTWADGTTGITGTVTAANSLIGTVGHDAVGGGGVGSSGVFPLPNGNYVVSSPGWNNAKGAATWANGTTGLTGVVSIANSLIGTSANDSVGGGNSEADISDTNLPNELGIIVLSNGNYVVSSPQWNNNAGAVTWASGTTGLAGAVSSTNSLVGTARSGGFVDEAGTTVVPLANGNYVVCSPGWNRNTGAVTWGDGTIGVTGAISASNSLTGSATGDQVGVGSIAALSNGNYVVSSYFWGGNKGAITWGTGTAGVKGAISSTNSLVGAAADDQAGGFIIPLKDGNYTVDSWRGGKGAATLGLGGAALTGVLGAGNSVLGTAANGDESIVLNYQPSIQQMVVGRPADNTVSLFNTAVALPVLAVSTGGSTLASGSTENFGSLLQGSKLDMSFTITNTGHASLAGLTITKDGTGQSMFTVVASPSATVLPGASTTLTVQFEPSSAGAKTAALHIASNDSAHSPFNVTLTGTGVTPVLPVVSSSPATAVTFDGATLNGSVNAKGFARTVTFDYGITKAYGSSATASQSPLNTSVATPVTASITGLLPHTKYNFRVHADGDLGSAEGANQTFITLNHVPVAAPQAVTALPSAKVAIDVLSAAADADGDALRISTFSQPGASVGTVTKAGTALVFTPAAAFAGGSFAYTVSDAFGGRSQPATVTLAPDSSFS